MKVASLLLIGVASCLPPWVSKEELDRALAENARMKIELDTAHKRHLIDEQRAESQTRALAELRAGSHAQEPHTVFVEMPAPTMPQPAPEPAQQQHGTWRLVGRWGVAREPECNVSVLVSFEGEAGYEGSGPGQAIRTPFVKMEYPNRQACPQEMFSALTMRLQFGCKASTMRTIASRGLDWSGESHILPPDAGVQPVYPDTLMHEAWAYACTQK